MLVARAGERATPPRIAPQPVRRYLNFARLPDPALEVARRVLDEDAGFRAEVTKAVDEERVGAAGWLFLTRPDGWQAEVEALVQKASAEELASKEDRAERGAQRRLAGAEAAATRAEAAATAALRDAQRARGELEVERAETRPLRDEVTRLRAELDEARASRAGTIAKLKEAEANLAARTAEVRSLRHELRMAQAELAQGDPAARPEPPAEDPAASARDEAAAAARDEALAIAVARATEAFAAASASLAEAGSLLGAEASPPASPARPDADPQPGRARPLRARRRAAPLPPGVRDDGPEAAEHLVRVPGVLLLIDGYNISNAQWWGQPPAEQRSRLLDACVELHARCGTAIEVVFDGDQATGSAGAAARSDVRYRFTSAGVEADDVLLDRVDEEPVERPVIVASSDRRVRDGARERGANVIGARQALSVLRRREA